MNTIKKFALVSTLTATLTFSALPFASADSLFNRTLKVGMSGDDVKQAQLMLKRAGYFNGQATGYFGSITAESVKKFQAAYQLTADGILGKATAAVLEQALGSGVSRGGDREEVSSTTAQSTGASQDSADQLISYAKQYLGMPYVYGSDGPNSFDCSGFTMYVYSHFGIGLPHSAASQAGQGTRVDRSELAPGDLIFFHTVSPGISHVGIYIGDGYFIHASSGAGRVVITPLSDSYYDARFVTASRVL